jgi:dolichol-phosphate mannosyltransferase
MGIVQNMGNPSISIVVPVYNEAACIPELIRRLTALRQNNVGKYEIFAVLVDDGSDDESKELLISYSLEHRWITTRLLTRNFGHQIAITAGMDVALSDYVAVIDGDLQDPPELIPEMVEQLINNGDQIVYGQRSTRQGESAVKLWSARQFYKLIRTISGLDIPLDTGDFRVMTRRARNILSELREQNRFLRGLAPWSGLKSSSFIYERDIRYSGHTKFTLRRMFDLAANAIISFSAAPLRALQSFGLIISAAGFVSMAVYVFLAVFSTNSSVIGILFSINVLSTGIVVTAVGVVGGYVHRIQEEVRNRPLYIVNEEE